MKLNDVFPYIRNLLNDEDSQGYRYTDSKLIQYAQDALRRMSIIRPDIFTEYQSFRTQPDAVLQKMPDDVDKIVDVEYDETSGTQIKKSEKASMDIEVPGWPAHKAAYTKLWIHDEDTIKYFFIYPKAPQNHSIVLKVLKVPEPTTVTDEFELPKLFKTILTDGIVFLAQSIDDEHISQKRAEMFKQMMLDGLSSEYSSRGITDKDEGKEDNVQPQ